MQAAAQASSSEGNLSQGELRRVLVASSVGTLFEWYDFYLYGSLAVFFGALFFPKGNETAQLLASLATFGAGFGVRPLGALVFGSLGDRTDQHGIDLTFFRQQRREAHALLLDGWWKYLVDPWTAKIGVDQDDTFFGLAKR